MSGGFEELPSAQPDQAWKALSLVNDWIRHAEAKTVAVLAATGVSTGVLYNVCRDWDSPSVIGLVVAVSSGVALLVAFVCCALALLPRLRVGKRSKDLPEDLSNLLFFKHIAKSYKGDSPTYAQVLTTLTSDPAEMTKHIANQVHANANVAHEKYRWVDSAVCLVALGVVLLAITSFVRVIGG